MDDYDLRQILGVLVYVWVMTDPRIGHAIINFARVVSRPTVLHTKMMDHLLRHLALRLDAGVTFHRNKPIKPLLIVDSEWGADMLDRRSLYAYFIVMCGSSVQWGVGKSTTVMLASSFAEFYSTRECFGAFVALLKELILALPESVNWSPFVCQQDNKGCIAFAEGLGRYAKKKSVHMRALWIAELVAMGLIVMKWKKTDEMAADICTKAVSKPIYRKHVPTVTGESYVAPPAVAKLATTAGAKTKSKKANKDVTQT